MRFFSGTVEAENLKGAQDALRKRVGANLRNMREMRGFSCQDVARIVGGMSAETIGNYERGATGMSLENAWRLADFYGVTLGALGGRIDYEPVTEGIPA